MDDLILLARAIYQSLNVVCCALGILAGCACAD